MGLIWALLIAALSIIGAALSRQLADEFKEWTPWVVNRLINRALQRLEPNRQERFREEWSSDINDTPGQIAKILKALGFSRAATRMSLDSCDVRALDWLGSTAKRSLDLILCSAMLLVSAPCLMIAVIAIYTECSGPILFRQTRVGMGGRRFALYKFRTMNPEGAPRVTLVGSVLRRFRIDEIPQLINVIKGEMSLVGPRPEQPFFVDAISKEIPDYEKRLSVKPGITGWAQIHCPYAATLEDAKVKHAYDMAYAKHRSFYLDLKILFQTIIVLFWQPRAS